MAEESSTAVAVPPRPAAENVPRERRSAALPLAAGGVGGVFAAICCIGPLALVLAGIGGAWVSTLTMFEPYRLIFLAAAAVALAFAWRRIYRPAAECAPGEVCAVPAARRGQRIAFWLMAAFVLAAGLSPYAAPLFY